MSQGCRRDVTGLIQSFIVPVIAARGQSAAFWGITPVFYRNVCARRRDASSPMASAHHQAVVNQHDQENDVRWGLPSAQSALNFACTGHGEESVSNLGTREAQLTFEIIGITSEVVRQRVTNVGYDL